MKNQPIIALLLCSVCLNSCQALFPEAKARIIVNLETPALTKAREEIDTGDYILTVVNSKGSTIYEGKYADSPDYFDVNAGTYTVSALSCKFDEPVYDKAQFGDEKAVVVKSGETIGVALNCTQLNSGLRLVVEDSFRDTFPDGELYLSSADGELLHDYDEARTAFFKPGLVKVEVCEGASRQSLFSRTLKARQIVSMSLASSSSKLAGGISVRVDTSRSYETGSYVYGKELGSDLEDAMSVLEALDCIGEEDVWVYGYIVGCASGTNSFCFEAPFPKATNILIGTRSGTTDKEYCLSVELRSGNIREELNLMSNPDLKGSKVYLKGDLVSAYFGIPGIKSVEEFAF